jgi:hypothetical protein
MNKLLILAFLYISGLAALNVDQWQNLRFSEQTPENHIYMRGEIDQTSINTNQVVYNSGAGLGEIDFSLLSGDTYQSLLPATQPRTYYGLRKQVGDNPLDVLPLYYSGTGAPPLNLMTHVADDEINYSITNYYDIVADYATFSDTRLFTAIQNRGGGFPLSGGFFVYNSFMSVFADPDIDPEAPGAIVWALHYVDASGLVTPGLYKITGTSLEDLERIGDISYQTNTASNTLVMSCDMADLLADPDFMAWFDPDNPRIGMISLTARITLSGAVDQDNSMGGILHPVPLYVDPTLGFSGQISNFGLQIEADDVYFQAEYDNPEDLFVFELEYHTANGDVYPLSSLDIDPTQTMYYRSENLLGILPEYDNEPGRVRVERLPDTYATTQWQSFSYILGLATAQNLDIIYEDDSVIISWEPINETLSGNPVTVDRYRLEASSDIDFGEYDILGENTEAFWQIESSPLEAWQFFRVVGIKDIP